MITQEELQGALRAEEERAPQPGDLIARVSAAAGRRRRRRRMAGAGIAAAVVAVAVAAVPTAVGQLGHGPSVRSAHSGSPSAGPSGKPSPSGSAAPRSGQILAPPEASGATSVESDPSVFASDPMLFRVGLSWLPPHIATLSWTSKRGKGEVIEGNTGPHVTVRSVRNRSDLNGVLAGTDPWGTVTVGGERAKMYQDDMFTYIVWQPAHGVWVAVETGSQDTATRVARGVRLDTVYQCASPGAFHDLPSGTTVSRCDMAVTSAGSLRYESSVSLSGPDRSIDVEISFTDTKAEMPGTDESQHVTVQGHEAYIMRNPSNQAYVSLHVPWLGGFGSMDVSSLSMSVDQVVAIADGVQVTGKPDQPGTWVTDPLSGS